MISTGGITNQNMPFSLFKGALVFFYCAYYPRIFSSMFCGEITTNRRQLYRFRVFKTADLKTSQTRRFRGKFAKHGSKKNNYFRNIISYKSAEMSDPFEECLHRPHQQHNVKNLRCMMTLTAVTLIQLGLIKYPIKIIITRVQDS